MQGLEFAPNNSGIFAKAMRVEREVDGHRVSPGQVDVSKHYLL